MTKARPGAIRGRLCYLGAADQTAPFEPRQIKPNPLRGAAWADVGGNPLACPGVDSRL